MVARHRDVGEWDYGDKRRVAGDLLILLCFLVETSLVVLEDVIFYNDFCPDGIVLLRLLEGGHSLSARDSERDGSS